MLFLSLFSTRFPQNLKGITILSFFLVIVLLLPTTGNSQNQANIWYFGRKAGLDFNTTPPTMLTNGSQNNGDVDEGHATVCDTLGNLLFYTNGMTVWDKNHAVMNNGTGLNGHWSATQCATVFPVPGDVTQTKYYLITSPVTGSATQIRYNIIDLNPATNGGYATGNITTKNVVMPGCGTYMMEALVSCPHFNGTDIWVIGHEAATPATDAGGDKFYVWLVSSGGVTLSNTYTLGYDYPRDPTGPSSRGIGIMKFNSCFNRLFISYYNASSRVEGFQFNNNTGIISNWPAPVSAPLVLDDYRNTSGTMTPWTSFAYGLEVSPNGRYLYVTKSGETGTREIVQYDLQAAGGTNAAIENSCVNLTPASPDGIRYGMLQLGPDGKIYHTLHQWNAIGAGGYCKISVINSPNSAGAAANYVEGAYTWPGTATNVGSTMGLPSFHKGFLAGVAAIRPGAGIGSLDEVCVGEPADFEANYSQDGSNWRWNIDANLNAVNDYFTQNITHTYNTAGEYEVVLTLDDATCGYTVTEKSTITVNPVINAAGSVSCNPARGSVTAPDPSYDYVWYSDAAATVPIATGTSNVSLPISGSGNVYLKAVSSATTDAPVSLENGYNGFPPDATTGVTSMPFEVHGSVLNFKSFKWSGPAPNWNASVVTTNYTVIIRDVPNTTEYYNATVPVITLCPSCGASNQFTENVNVVLPPGDYEIVITGGDKRQVANWRAQYGPTTDAEGALTYRTSGTNNAIASDFEYTLTTITATGLPCSKVATIPFNCPLPVTWLDFTANHTNEGNLLKWSTASETNNGYFVVERSYDGVSFEAIAQVAGAGNTIANSYYTYLDKNVENGIVYYRIKQVDMDGQSSYSGIRVIQSKNSFIISVQPNPNNGIFSLVYQGLEEPMDVVIYNNLGQIVWRQTAESSSGLGELEINLAHLAKGVYHLVSGTSTRKIVIE